MRNKETLHKLMYHSYLSEAENNFRHKNTAYYLYDFYESKKRTSFQNQHTTSYHSDPLDKQKAYDDETAHIRSLHGTINYKKLFGQTKQANLKWYKLTTRNSQNQSENNELDSVVHSTTTNTEDKDTTFGTNRDYEE